MPPAAGPCLPSGPRPGVGTRRIAHAENQSREGHSIIPCRPATTPCPLCTSPTTSSTLHPIIPRPAVASLAPSLPSVHHGRRSSTAGSCRRGIARLHHVCAPLDHYQCSHHRRQTPNRLLIWYSHDAHDETCSCDVSDALCKLKFRNGGFLSGLTMWSPQRQDGDTKMVGQAYTVQYAPLDDPRPKYPTHYVCSVLSSRGWGHVCAELVE